MSRWNIFDLETGLFTGRVISGPDDPEFLELNTPAGCGLAIGVTDAPSQRVDLQVLALIAAMETSLQESLGTEAESSIATDLDNLRRVLLLDYIPPAPSADHEWNSDRKRWQLRPEVAEQQRKQAAAMAQIELLDARSIRALREIRLAEIKGEPVPEESRARLDAIEREIEGLRPDVAGTIPETVVR